jgi:hypothetical protein
VSKYLSVQVGDLLDEFADAIQSQKKDSSCWGVYKKIPYKDWKMLSKGRDEFLCARWLDKNLGDFEIWTSEFYMCLNTHDESLGEFIWWNYEDIIEGPIKENKSLTYTRDDSISSLALANTVDFSNAITKANTAIGTLGEAIKKAKLEVTQDSFLINGKTIEEIIDEVTGVAMTTRKENDNMTNLFKNFDFGSCENDNVKMSMYGIAVKNPTGTWVSYDSKSGNVIDVDILNFNGKYLYKMPSAIKDIKAGDVIIHNRKPVFVTRVEDGKILCVDPAAGEEKIVLPTRNMFGFDFVTRVVNLFGDVTKGVSADSPFGNMLPIMMLADEKNNDMLPLFFMMNGGKMDATNPLMMYFLMKDGTKSDLLPLLLLTNGNAFNMNPACKCENCESAN